MSVTPSVPRCGPVVVCDVIGTLVDEIGTVTSALVQALGAHEVSAERAGRLAQRWLDDVGMVRSRIAGRAEPWRDDAALRRSMLTDLLAAEHIDLLPQQFADLAGVGHRLVAWPGATDQVGRLASRATVAALTNASTDELASISCSQGLHWHAALSTALARTYKPASAAYQLAIDQLAVDPGETFFVAAHPWDLRGAAAAGFRTAYLPRPGADLPDEADRFDLTIATLDELPML